MKPQINQCPQCSLDAQAILFEMNEVGMSFACDLGHRTTVLVKFQLTEITFIDAETQKVIRHEKMRIKEKPVSMAH